MQHVIEDFKFLSSPIVSSEDDTITYNMVFVKDAKPAGSLTLNPFSQKWRIVISKTGISSKGEYNLRRHLEIIEKTYIAPAKPEQKKDSTTI